MGYSELNCHLCGVSFTIGRLRSLEEAQRPDPDPDCSEVDVNLIVSYILNERANMAECDAEGCLVLQAAKKIPNRGDSDDGSQYDDDAAEDPGMDPYEYDSPEEDAPEQGDSDVDMMDAVSVPESTVDSSEGDVGTGQLVYRRQRAARATLPFIPWRKRPRDEDSSGEEHYPDQDSDSEREYGDAARSVLNLNEHIPGPECTSMGGYHWKRISLAEMRGCTIAQVLAPKAEDWEPSDDDEPFERDPDCHFFLTGLCDDVPSRDCNGPRCFPERHGLGDIEADNFLCTEERAAETGMPFHPTCFEVFKRASLWRTGEVDVRSLMEWFRLEAAYDLFRDIPRSPAVLRGRDQCWRHTKGDEHIVANPCYIPTWDRVMSTARGLAAASPSESHAPSVQVAAPEEDNASATRANGTSQDRFTSLPDSVRQRIISHLVTQPRDIANLRLASRAFRQLSQSAFRDMLLHQHPWAWEAWCSLPYSFWTTTTGRLLEKKDKERRQRQKSLERSIAILLEEADDDEGDNAAAAQLLQEQLEAEKRGVPKEDAPVAQLPREGTDWRALYMHLRRPRRKWPKGLRNRRRIWADCDHILDSIAKRTQEGKIGPGIFVDPVKMTTDYYQRQLAKRTY